MKKLFTVALLGFAFSAYAQDFAVVVNKRPNYVTSQQQQCSVQDVVVNHGNNNGAVIGGVAGAALGSTVGSNHRDRLAGAVIGGLVGGAIGHEVSKGQPEVQQRTVCRYVPITVQQGEFVTFQYQGRTFTQLIN